MVGVEGDVAATNLNGGRTSGYTDGVNAGGITTAFSAEFFTSTDKTNWMAMATARVGYAWNRTLFYVKGGALADGMRRWRSRPPSDLARSKPARSAPAPALRFTPEPKRRYALVSTSVGSADISLPQLLRARLA